MRTCSVAGGAARVRSLVRFTATRGDQGNRATGDNDPTEKRTLSCKPRVHERELYRDALGAQCCLRRNIELRGLERLAIRARL